MQLLTMGQAVLVPEASVASVDLISAAEALISETFLEIFLAVAEAAQEETVLRRAQMSMRPFASPLRRLFLA